MPAPQSGNHTHIGYSDEAYINERYRSIGLVTAPVAKAEFLAQSLSAIGKSVEWKELRPSDRLPVVKKRLRVAVEQALAGHIRIDVLVWDMEDSRHRDLPGRDDTADWERMFLHLLATTMKKWPDDASWKIYPDERSDVYWPTLKDFLPSKQSRWYAAQSQQRSMGLSREALGLRQRVEGIEQATSEHPIIQLADLVCGPDCVLLA